MYKVYNIELVFNKGSDNIVYRANSKQEADFIQEKKEQDGWKLISRKKIERKF